ncbi:MAG: 2Fe-2S iron-sulfur cluster-binding protein, partial [Sphaerochaetaceae bacterium]
MDKMVDLSIDGKSVAVPEGTRIIEACKLAGVTIPSLCYLQDVSAHGSCGICVVEIEGFKRLVRSCMHMVQKDMVIHTHTERVMQARKMNLELLLANHPLLCTTCERNLNCTLQSLAWQLGVRESRFGRTKKQVLPIDCSSASIVRNPNACILCNRCVEVCASMQEVHAIDMMQRGLRTTVSTFFDEGLGASVCTNCG